jgi:predicted mannosyl-3-phosphoglycerate phosphatase (HAD superfamily)
MREPRRVGALNRKWAYNGKEVDQGIARKAQQEPEGEMEGTETATAAEAP